MAQSQAEFRFQHRHALPGQTRLFFPVSPCHAATALHERSGSTIEPTHRRHHEWEAIVVVAEAEAEAVVAGGTAAGGPRDYHA